MIKTAIDSNILSALWSKEPDHEQISNQLNHAWDEGRLILSAPAYCELLAYPTASQKTILGFAESMNIEIDFQLDEPVWTAAGKAYADYARRRRHSGGGETKRLLSDFIIGAHAKFRADRLITRDVSRYKRDFPELKLLSLSQ